MDIATGTGLYSRKSAVPAAYFGDVSKRCVMHVKTFSEMFSDLPSMPKRFKSKGLDAVSVHRRIFIRGTKDSDGVV